MIDVVCVSEDNEVYLSNSKYDVRGALRTLLNAPLVPTKFIMSEQDYKDILAWSGGAK